MIGKYANYNGRFINGKIKSGNLEVNKNSEVVMNKNRIQFVGDPVSDMDATNLSSVKNCILNRERSCTILKPIDSELNNGNHISLANRYIFIDLSNTNKKHITGTIGSSAIIGQKITVILTKKKSKKQKCTLTIKNIAGSSDSSVDSKDGDDFRKITLNHRGNLFTIVSDGSGWFKIG